MRARSSSPSWSATAADRAWLQFLHITTLFGTVDVWRRSERQSWMGDRRSHSCLHGDEQAVKGVEWFVMMDSSMVASILQRGSGEVAQPLFVCFCIHSLESVCLK